MSSLRRRATVWWGDWGGVVSFWGCVVLVCLVMLAIAGIGSSYYEAKRAESCEESGEISGYAYRYAERSGCWLFVNGRWLPARSLGGAEP